MQFTGIKNVFIYISAIFLCTESCKCFVVNRASQDVFDYLNGQNCVQDSVEFGSQRCKCKNNKRTIATGEDNPIDCVDNSIIDSGKNINLPYNSMQYLFLFHKIS